MKLSPRQIVVRAREAAALLLGVLDRQGVVARFLDRYAAENHRPTRADQPAHYREKLETIRHEAVLAMVLHVDTILSQRLKPILPLRVKPHCDKTMKVAHIRGRAKPEVQDPTVDLFRQEFFVALGEALDWTEEDFQEFWRDLDLYRRLSVTARSRASVSGPFADRVALLLDPSLMEQARHAAARFQTDLAAAADRVLRKVLSRRRAN